MAVWVYYHMWTSWKAAAVLLCEWSVIYSIYIYTHFLLLANFMLLWSQSQGCKAKLFQGQCCSLVVNLTRTLVCPPCQLLSDCNITQPLLQALLTKIWWGAMTTDTAISKLVVSFFCPALIWTNLIKFRWSVWCYMSSPFRCTVLSFSLCALTLSCVCVRVCVCQRWGTWQS